MSGTIASHESPVHCSRGQLQRAKGPARGAADAADPTACRAAAGAAESCPSWPRNALVAAFPKPRPRALASRGTDILSRAPGGTE